MNFTSADDVRTVQKALPFSREDAEEFDLSASCFSSDAMRASRRSRAA